MPLSVRLGCLACRGFAAAIIICALEIFSERCDAFMVNNNFHAVLSTITPTPSKATSHAKKDRLSEVIEDLDQNDWDGIPIEGAHDEEFDSEDDNPFVPSLSFMSMANSLPSPVFDNSSGINAGKLHRQSEIESDPDQDDLLEMGGDPFFLGDEWDGEPIEGAHDEEFEPGSGKIDIADMFVPSASFMSMVNSVPSPIIGTEFDPLRNMGKLHKDELKGDNQICETDLLEMGGDPFFLDDDCREVSRSETSLDFDRHNDFELEWDGTVDEDAHLDFD